MRPSSHTQNSVIAALLFGAVCLATSAGAQVIRVEPTLLDFGDMKQRETRTATVTITNDGGGRLELGEVKVDCGCTVPTLVKTALGPGESTTMEVQFNSKNFNGNIVKLVTIHSNDPDQPRQEVMIAAKVKAAMVIEPAGRRLTFERSPQGESQKMSITLTSLGPDPLQVTAPAKSKKSLFSLKAFNGQKGNPLVAVVEVTVPADAPAGRHTDMARLKTNVPGMEKVDFYLNSWIQSELVLDIEAVKFRFKKDLKQTITITPSGKGTKFKITDVEIDMPEIKVDYENNKGQEALVHLSGQAVAKTDPRAVKFRGRLRGTLIIHTDLESIPTIEVPVSYMLRM